MAENSEEIIATAIHPEKGSEIILFKKTWTEHILPRHQEMSECLEGMDCLQEVIDTLENPDIIREGRNPETEELFIRYTSREDFGEFKGFSVSTRVIPCGQIVTTAYHDVISEKKGAIKYRKPTKEN